MKSVFIFVFMFLLACVAKGQEILFKKNIRMARGVSRERREAFPVASVSGQGVSLFLVDTKFVRGLLFNGAMDLTDSVEGERPVSKFDELLGSSQSDGRYNLYFANNAHNALAVTRCDYAQKQVLQYLVKMPFKGQKYVGTASYKGKFYLFTVTKGTSMLNVYAFTDHVHYTTHAYDFKNEHFTINAAYHGLYDALYQNSFVTVDNDVPNAIDLASKKNKLYTFDNKLVLTLDNQDTRTHVITIDLATMEKSLKVYNQSQVDCEVAAFSRSNSNSYIYKNVLYQIRVCPQAMVYSLTNLQTGETLNEFRAEKDGEMDFKNGAIVQQGGKVTIFSPEERELSKTRQFLRKVSAADPGISVYETGEALEVTLGSYKEMTQGGGGSGMMMSPGGTIMTPMGAVTTAPTYNPTFNGYNSYKTTKSVFMKSLLNPATYQHRAGEPVKNAFDKIQTFTKDLEEGMTAETIFKRDQFLLLGYYYKPDKRYMILAFRD